MEEPRSVLLVDDDDDIRTIAEISLAQVGGIPTTLAASGQEGLHLAGVVRPDVILLDMMMPDLDGLATLALLRADPATAHIPVIFMTAKVQRRDTGRYRDSGAIGVIPKPFDPMTLADEVRALVAGADSF